MSAQAQDGPQDGPRVGSLAEETARLLEALQQTASRWGGPGHGSSGAGSAAGPDGAQPGAEHDHRHHHDGHVPSACRVCPVCQLVARVQQVRPEVVHHLAEAAASVVAALGELAADHSRPAGRPPARPDVQHIDISD